MNSTELCKISLETLEEAKASDSVVIDVHTRRLEDFMIICTAHSSTHMKSTAQKLKKRFKSLNQDVVMTGEDSGEWCIVSVPGIYVHILLQSSRDNYQLEKLFDPEIKLEKQFI